MGSPILVVAAALIDAQGRCLMQQRPADKQHGGLWEFPGGKVEPGEAPADALARELAEGARLVIYNKPTYGLDLANTLAIRQRILEVARQGKGVVVISTDLEELLSLCDRIAVMERGRIAGIVDYGEEARTEVGRLMIGLEP